MEQPVLQDQRVRRAHQVPRGLQGQQVQMVHKVRRELQELMVQLGLQAQ